MLNTAFSFEMENGIDGEVSVAVPSKVTTFVCRQCPMPTHTLALCARQVSVAVPLKVTIFGSSMGIHPQGSTFSMGTPSISTKLTRSVSMKVAIDFGVEATALSVMAAGASFSASASANAALNLQGGSCGVEAEIAVTLSAGLQMPDLNPPDLNLCGAPLFAFPALPIPSFGVSIPIPIGKWALQASADYVSKPKPTATAVKAQLPKPGDWVLSEPGQNCDQACAAENRLCDANELAQITCAHTAACQASAAAQKKIQEVCRPESTQ